MVWKCVDQIEGIADVFTGYDFSGASDWNNDSINLSHPDNADMSVQFRVPEGILEAASSELFLLIGLNWLSETEDCKFEVQLNG